MESQSDEDAISAHKKLAKSLCKLLSTSGEYPLKASISAGDYTFHYAIDNNIEYITLCDKAYPRLLAFSFLTELSKGFSDEIKSSSSGWSGVTSIVRPYAFIRFEPFIQSTRKRYQNTRQLRPQEDLVELSSRIQSIPVLRADDVFGNEYSKSSNAPISSFPSMDSLKKTANSISEALHDATSDVLPSSSANKNRRSLTSTVMYWTSLMVFGIDALYLLFTWMPQLAFWSSLNDSTAAGITYYLVVTLGLLSPFLALQAYLIKSSNGKIPNRLADLSTVHAIITIIFLIYAVFFAGAPASLTSETAPSTSVSFSSTLPTAVSPVMSAPAANVTMNANQTLSANDTILSAAAGQSVKTTAGPLIAGSIPVLPSGIVIVKIIYLIPMFFSIGLGTLRRWAGQRGPKGRKD
ncbi:SNAP receptor [Dinochytrium kinnereticum]|nr:SNAP receptor [Dinochytrium kinnereticum]